jgi:uncharacterized protein
MDILTPTTPSMKFNLEINAGNYHIQSYGPGQVNVLLAAAHAAPEIFHKSFVVTPRELLRDWPPQSFADICEADFGLIALLQPELVLFGSGAELRFPAPAMTAGLLNQGIGVEVMSTGAACRTYNILMTEGRNVAAALLMI